MKKREWELESIVFETLFTNININNHETMNCLHYLFNKEWKNKQITYHHEFINKQFILFLMARDKDVKLPPMI